MASFLSESYLKPKLTDIQLVNKMIEEKNNKTSFETKAIKFLKQLVISQWKTIVIILFIIALFYWRYSEIKNIRKQNLDTNKINKTNKSYSTYNEYEDDSEIETSEE